MDKKSDGNGWGSGEVKGSSDTAEIANVEMTFCERGRDNWMESALKWYGGVEDEAEISTGERKYRCLCRRQEQLYYFRNLAIG